jgi:hypothetical protein
METQSVLNNTITLFRYHSPENSLTNALDLCQGLRSESTEAQIDDSIPLPPCDILILTTTRMVKLPGNRPGLPGNVISFYIVPLDPAPACRQAGTDGTCGTRSGQISSIPFKALME